MLHLIKLAVGARERADIARHQSARTSPGEPVAIFTRQYPKRAPALVDGGSLYWVVAGLVSVRQRILDLQPWRYADGTRATRIGVAPALIPLVPRPVRAFQGWRYLRPEDAPPDLTGAALEAMPEDLRRRLAELCLL